MSTSHPTAVCPDIPPHAVAIQAAALITTLHEIEGTITNPSHRRELTQILTTTGLTLLQVARRYREPTTQRARVIAKLQSQQPPHPNN